MLVVFQPTGILSTAEAREKGAREIPAVIETLFSTDIVSSSLPGGVQLHWADSF